MRNEKVLVIGGAGFIGGNLTLKLINSGYDVRVFTRSGRSVKNISKYLDKTELVFGDFMDEHALRMAVRGVDKVVHLVSTTFPGTSLESGVYDIYSNLVPTVRLLEICRETGVKNIVYASSGGTIYGEPEHDLIDEEHPLNPKSMYGHSKKVIESYLTFFSKNFDMNIQVLRVSNPYGPFQNPYGAQGLVAVAFGCLIDNRVCTVFGNGNVVRDYIYIDDVMTAFIHALNAEHANVLNISSGHGHSINEVLTLVENVAGQEIKKKYLPERRGDVMVNVLDNALAMKTYDWQLKYTMEQGIAKTWDWILSSMKIEL